MKIAMFGHKRIPSREGGVEIVVEQLSTRMAALGHQVTCYDRSSTPKSGHPQQNQHHGVRIRQVLTVNRKGLAAVSASFFASLACSFSDAQVVHIHAEGPAAMCFLPRLLGKRVIVTIHGLDWQREKWKGSPAAAYIRWGERMAARYAHEIIVLSRAAQQYFLQRYGRETTYIPNGVGTPNRRQADRIRTCYGLEPDSYVLFLGRLVPEKGIHCLIEAWKLAELDKKLVIAGRSSDTDDYVRRLKKQAGGDPDILFTGFVQEDVLEELYSNAWVYVLPSRLEGMPLGLLEAMSYGCCCVVADIPECTEVTAGHALAVPPGDSAALARCLKELRTDGALMAAMKTAAAEHIRRSFSWEKTVESTLKLYAGKGGS